MLNIFVRYSLIFPFHLYITETKLPKMLLISIFLFLAKRCLISLRNVVASTSSNITPHKVSKLKRFIIIKLVQLKRSHFLDCHFYPLLLSWVISWGSSFQSTRSRSMQPGTIITLSFHCLKFVPLNTITELMLAKIIEAEATEYIIRLYQVYNWYAYNKIPSKKLMLSLWI